MPPRAEKKRKFLVFTTICIIIYYKNVKNFFAFHIPFISSTGIPVDWAIYSAAHSPTVMVSRAIQFIVKYAKPPFGVIF